MHLCTQQLPQMGDDRAIALFGSGGTVETVSSLICESTAMLEVSRRIDHAAEVDSPVLIWGEKGAGKKLIAEMIHQRSRQSDGPLVVVPTEKSRSPSAEGELFGTATEHGKLEYAVGGTLLIDEITGLSPTAQAKLLDVAEGRYFADRDDLWGRSTELRLMATTQNELAESVERGGIREDLYYRLAVVTIHVPPLRERREDFPRLVQEMLSELCAIHEKPVPIVDLELMQQLVEHPWPDNGRQLRDCLERMVLAQDAELLGVECLPPSYFVDERNLGDIIPPRQIDRLDELEHAAVLRALKAHEGNRTQAAKMLGISVRTLQRKLKQWELT